MSILRRMSDVFQQKVNSAIDKAEDPAQALDLSYQKQQPEVTAQKLQAKIEAFRMQKDTMKAQYTAAKASTQVGEQLTGLSEQIADASMMVDRSKEKIAQMQARSAAIDQLVDSGVL